jgi:hypothetical protein
MKELGEDFIQVHLWLDCLKPIVGSKHRQFRHNLETVNMLREFVGEREAQAAEIHIRRDWILNLGKEIPTYEEIRTKWWLYGW